MNVPVDRDHDRAWKQEYLAILVKYMPSLEILTTTTATSLMSSVIMYTEAGFELHGDRASIVRVLTDVLRIMQSANPLIAAQALGLLSDEQTAMLQAQAEVMRKNLLRAGLTR